MKIRKYLSVLMILLLVFSFSHIAKAEGNPTTGAIWTTTKDGSAVDFNIYDSKSDVFLNGGPRNANGGNSLVDGYYYVKVTDPSGNELLGESDVAAITVVNGSFEKLYNLYELTNFGDTPNDGGEYKVWISKNPEFPNSESKTDNFKVKPEESRSITIVKFYDKNTNGKQDSGENGIQGWKFTVKDNETNASVDYFTGADGTLTINDLTAGSYTITEWKADQNCWVNTTELEVVVTLTTNDMNETAYFGNVCLGSGNGKTLGFWSNKNGQLLFNSAYLTGLKLMDSNGSLAALKDYRTFRTWILNATATDMRYMLSAQLAAMKLNVEAGLVTGNSVVYLGENYGLRFTTVANLITLANDALVSVDATRAYQEYLKNALDSANNNLNFVQNAQCCSPTFTGTPVDCR
jgi:hypothetical protein